MFSTLPTAKMYRTTLLVLLFQCLFFQGFGIRHQCTEKAEFINGQYYWYCRYPVLYPDGEIPHVSKVNSALILHMLWNYCQNIETVENCLTDLTEPCSEDYREMYTRLAAKSNDICDGHEVKTAIKQRLESIPTELYVREEDVEAARAITQQCLENALMFIENSETLPSFNYDRNIQTVIPSVEVMFDRFASCTRSTLSQQEQMGEDEALLMSIVTVVVPYLEYTLGFNTTLFFDV